MHVGYLGAGRMAAPMIRNLLADGHSVSVWNRSADKTAPLVAAGAQAAATPAAACPAGGIVLSCLADDAALEAVCADGSVAGALGAGGVHVAMATVSAACTTALAAAHADAGAVYLAAPILGRPDAVAARVQSFLLAGPDPDAARVLPLLEQLGKQVFRFGAEPAAASVAKINFNFLIAAAVEAMAEAFAVVEKSGLDPRAFLDMVTGSAFGCPLYQNYGRMLVEQDWDDAAFTLRLGLKDVRLASASASAVDARMRLGELLEARFEAALEAGLGDKDWTAVGIDIRREAGL